jgi:hypothetical protein
MECYYPPAAVPSRLAATAKKEIIVSMKDWKHFVTVFLQ